MTARSATAPNPTQHTVLSCSNTADFLAALPFLTGFTADESLFLVLFTGKRSAGSVRIDLPADPSHTAPILDALTSFLHETGAGAAGPAIVITTSQTFADTGDIPWRGLARIIQRRFRREGWQLRELAIVAADGWTGMLDPHTHRGGRPLSEIESSSVTALAARSGRTHVPLDRLGRLPSVDAARTAAVRAQLAELDRHDSASAPKHAAVAPLNGIARVADACFASDESAASVEVEPRLCARLIRASERPESWLVLALSMIADLRSVTRRIDAFTPDTSDISDGISIGEVSRLTGPGRHAESNSAESSSADTSSADTSTAETSTAVTSQAGFGRLLTEFAEVPPEPERLVRAIAILLEVTAHAPRARRPGLLAVLAWAWWIRGSQSVAIRVAEESLEIAPEHVLSATVRRIIETPPAWPFRRMASTDDTDQG